jgi:hypothetical protein
MPYKRKTTIVENVKTTPNEWFANDLIYQATELQEEGKKLKE